MFASAQLRHLPLGDRPRVDPLPQRPHLYVTCVVLTSLSIYSDVLSMVDFPVTLARV